MADEEETREIVGFELELIVVGPDYRDRIRLSDTDLAGLRPTYEDVHGLTFERYRGDSDDEYVEIRFDYVISRTMRTIYQEPDRAQEEMISSGVDLPPEIRMNREDVE